MPGHRLVFLCSLALCLEFGGPANAQPVFIGCTASLANQPQTTAKLVDVDRNTGLATNPRETGIYALGGITYQPGTNLLFGLTTFASNPANSLVRLDPATGAVTLVGATGLSGIVEGDLAFSPIDGMLYGLQDFGPSFDQRNLFRINPLTGVATVIGSLASAGDFSSLAISNQGAFYSIGTGPTGPPDSKLVQIDPGTGAILNSVALSVQVGSAVGMAIDPATGEVYFADGGGAGTNQLYQIDVNTGIASLIGSTGQPPGLSGLAFSSVPEPSGLILVPVGVLILRTCRRRKFI